MPRQRNVDSAAVQYYADCLRDQLKARLYQDINTGEERLELTHPQLAKPRRVSLASAAEARRFLGAWPRWAELVRGGGPYFSDLQGLRLKQVEDSYLLPAMQRVANEDRRRHRGIETKGSEVDEAVVTAMYHDLLSRSKSVGVTVHRGHTRLDISAKDGRQCPIRIATTGKKGDGFYYALRHYTGEWAEEWAQGLGLDGLQGDYHVRRRVVLEHAAVACKRLADFSTLMLREVGVG
jgi:hypothetical protein